MKKTIQKKVPPRPTMKVTVRKTGKVKNVSAPLIRKSLTPGTVCIMLAGPHKGKRVVMLKALQRGDLVITGPRKLNGVPLRLENHRYVAATSTKIPIDGLDLSKFDDQYFLRKKTRGPRKEKDTSLFTKEKSNEKKEISPEKLADRKSVDSFVIKALGKDELLKQYLKTKFTLRDRMYPHAIKF